MFNLNMYYNMFSLLVMYLQNNSLKVRTFVEWFYIYIIC